MIPHPHCLGLQPGAWPPKAGGGGPLHRVLAPHAALHLPAPPGSTAEAARIVYPPEAQTIIVTKGQSLILECVASGIPPPRVTWAKDGSSVAGYNKTRFLLSNLLIDTTSEDDSGTYRCMADNGVGEPGAAVILYNVQVFGECLLQTFFSSVFSVVGVVFLDTPNPKAQMGSGAL